MFVIFPFHQNSSVASIQTSDMGVTVIVTGTDILCGNKDTRNMQLLLRQFNLCWARWSPKWGTNLGPLEYKAGVL